MPLPVPYSQQDILDLFDRILPQAYLAPLKNPGPGYELLQAFAAAAARVSTGVNNQNIGSFILSAFGPALSTGVAQFSRPAGPTPAFVLLQGTQVQTATNGRTFVTTQDVAFGAGVLGPLDVPVQAIAPGFEWNVPGPRLTANGDALPGNISVILLLEEDPILADTTLTVSQVDGTAGGQPGALDQLGLDRGIKRLPGESDDHYRLRVRALPDTVSPVAVQRVVDQYLDPFDTVAQFIETWQASYQTCWDCPPGLPGIDETLFVYDDPRPVPPFRDRWLDEIDGEGAFIFAVGNIATIQDYGFAYDDPAQNGQQLVAPATQGQRGVPAFDVPDTIAQIGLLVPLWDGRDLPKEAAYRGLFELLQEIKAAGVSATVVVNF